MGDGDWGDYGGDSDDVESDSNTSNSSTNDWPNTREGRLSKRIYELET